MSSFGFGFLAIAIIAILLLLIVIICAFVIPIWSIVDCIKSETVSTNKKILWVLGIFFLWPLLSYVYSAFISKHPRLRKMGQFSFIFVLLVTAASIVFYPKLKGMMKESATQARLELEKATYDGVSPLEIQDLKTAAATLESEIDQMTFLEMNSRSSSNKAHLILNLLSSILLDKKVTTEEYKEWILIYNSRSTISPEELSEKKSEINRRNLENLANNMKQIEKEMQELDSGK